MAKATSIDASCNLEAKPLSPGKPTEPHLMPTHTGSQHMTSHAPAGRQPRSRVAPVDAVGSKVPSRAETKDTHNNYKNSNYQTTCSETKDK